MPCLLFALRIISGSTVLATSATASSPLSSLAKIQRSPAFVNSKERMPKKSTASTSLGGGGVPDCHGEATPQLGQGIELVLAVELVDQQPIVLAAAGGALAGALQLRAVLDHPVEGDRKPGRAAQVVARAMADAEMDAWRRLPDLEPWRRDAPGGEPSPRAHAGRLPRGSQKSRSFQRAP